MAAQTETANSGDIAIVGMSARFPGSDTLDRFWHTIAAGVEAIRDFTPDALVERGVDPSAARAANYVKRAPVLDGVDLFDAAFFGFSPREAELMDPQHRLFLECAWEALEHSGHDRSRADRTVGVYAGTSLSTYLLFNLLEVPAIRDATDTFPFMVGNDKDFLSTRVSYQLNLRGPSIDVQSGCSTSLVAVHLACEGLISWQCDVALAGGVSVNIPQRTGCHFHEGGVTSPDGRCRPFDAAGRGTIFGSGAGVVVLKRAADAIADGDTIYALIKGSAINNDGSAKLGYTAPSVDGQAEVIARAHAVAGVAARDISYVEAHGTGTALGDPVEVEALTKAFRTTTGDRGFCAIGSVKANIGHLDAAAGIASLIKTVLAIQHRRLPPLVNFTSANPQIDFPASPFYVTTSGVDWPAAATPRRAGVSSFGIGGTNAHVVVEEAAPPFESDAVETPQILVWSAKTAPALDAMTSNLRQHLEAHRDQSVADVAYTLQVGRQAFAHRSAVVAGSLDDALAAIDAGSMLRAAGRVENRPVAFLFPGQGAQHVGMGRALYDHQPIFRAHVDRCCELAASTLGRDLREVLYPAEGDDAAAAAALRGTDIAQPALFAVEYALAQLWMHWGVRPFAMLGHSIGEITAACLAGVFSLEDAVTLVVVRGRMMAGVSPGAMLAVALPDTEIAALLADSRVSVAARNHPRQSVLSGPAAAIDEADRSLAARGVVCHRLAVSHGFHSAMMDPILPSFADQVARLRLETPAIPFVSNVTGTWISPGEATDPGYWARHLRATVRFADGVSTLMREGPAAIEVGPGQTLTSIVRSHPDRRRDQPVVASLSHRPEPASDAVAIASAVAQLWTSGVAVDWHALHRGERRRVVALPTYPFERQRFWIDPRRDAARHTGKADPPEWFYTPAWKRTLPPERVPDTEAGARWLIFGDDGELTSGVLQGLKAAGHQAVLVTPGDRFERIGSDRFRVAPDARGDYERLSRALGDEGGVPDCLLHLWATAEPDERSAAERFARGQVNGLYSLLHLIRATASRRDQALRLWVAAAGVHDVTGQERVRPEHATLLALCDVAPQELPNVSCHVVDLEPGVDAADVRGVADALVSEMMSRAPVRRVSYRARQRWIPDFDRVRLDAPAEPPFRRGGVYLIAGGLGAIGLTLAEHLAATVQPRLLLLHRSTFPRRAEWADWLGSHGADDPTTRVIRRLAAIDERGERVHLVRADLGDREELAAALREAERRFGPFDGVIHAAGLSGIAAFKTIGETDLDDCERHFRAKAYGLQHLDDWLGDRTLDFRIAFSSNAAILGGPGLLGHAAAHRFMDAFAAATLRRPGGGWLAIDWDAWTFDASDTPARAAPAAVHAVTAAEGIDALRRVVARTRAGRVVVSSGDLPARIAEWIDRVEPRPPAVESVAHARPALDVAYVGPQNDVERTIAGIWQATLGLEEVGVNDNLFELGGNSLLGAEIVRQVKQALGCDVPVVRLFEQPTIRTFAASLASGPADSREVAAPRSARGERRRGLLRQQRERYREHA